MIRLYAMETSIACNFFILSDDFTSWNSFRPTNILTWCITAPLHSLTLIFKSNQSVNSIWSQQTEYTVKLL